MRSWHLLFLFSTIIITYLVLGTLWHSFLCLMTGMSRQRLAGAALQLCSTLGRHTCPANQESVLW